MELDLETFLTILYVMVDDLYVVSSYRSSPRVGPYPVSAIGRCCVWDWQPNGGGVPWKTERDFVRYALKHLRPLFPGMTSQSAFNRRLRRLWGAIILIQQAVADQL